MMNDKTLRRICQAGAVLKYGWPDYYHVIEDAIQAYLSNTFRGARA